MPVLGATISGNTIEDTLGGGVLDVDHGPNTKSNIGRVYLSALLTDNTGVWTTDFVSQSASNGQLHALTLGMAPSHDPGELLVAVAGNQVEGPAGVVSGATEFTAAATVGGQMVTDQGTELPTVAMAAPTGLALVDDTGTSGIDGQTSDPHLQFDPIALAVGYEYSLNGAAGTYQPVATPSSFVPQGLNAGFNAVFVHAYDAVGDRGPDALIEFAYVPDPTGGAAGSTPVPTRTVAYLYGPSGAGTMVPLGQSIILTAAEESGAPLAITIQTVGAGPGGPTVSNPAPGTVTIADQGEAASQGSEASGSTDGGSGTPAASTSDTTADAGTTPTASATPTSAGDELAPSEGGGDLTSTPPPGVAPGGGSPQSTTQTLSTSRDSVFALTKPPLASSGPVPGGAKHTHTPRWGRSPDPFRKAGSGVHSFGMHSHKHINHVIKQSGPHAPVLGGRRG
jgi:hypothetical protein